MNIEAVAFDLDGTLYSRASMYRLSIPLAARHPRFLFHFGRVRRALHTLGAIDDFRRTQARLLAESLRVDQARAEALIERIIYGEWTANLRGIRPFPHVTEALAGLRDSGLRLGLMSDYPVLDKLRFLGLEGMWDASFSSEEVGHLKPNPLPFLRLVRDLGVEPSRILYVGDNLCYDVEGAAAVGMRTALISRAGSCADLTFRSYRGFADLVKQRFKN